MGYEVREPFVGDVRKSLGEICWKLEILENFKHSCTSSCAVETANRKDNASKSCFFEASSYPVTANLIEEASKSLITPISTCTDICRLFTYINESTYLVSSHEIYSDSGTFFSS